MFGWLERIIVFTLVMLKRFLASIILFYILGWKTDKGFNSYYPYRRGKHIITYANASRLDQTLGVLFCISYDIPYISVGAQEVENIPVLGYVLKRAGIIFIDRMRNTNTVKYISERLKIHENFVFAVTLTSEKTKTRNIKIKPKFYQLAYDTHANVHIMKIDFTTQTVSMERIVPDTIIQTQTYEKIKEIMLEAIQKEKSYDLSSFRTSIINVNRSILTYMPPLIVICILAKVLF